MITIISNDVKAIKEIEEAFDLKVVNNSNDLVAFLTQRDPGLVLIDNDLKEEKGLDIYKKIKQLDPRLKVIMLSSSLDIAAVVAATKLGALDFLPKPVDKSKLAAAVNEALKEKETNSRLAGLSNIHWLQGNSVLLSVLLREIRAVTGDLLDIVLTGEAGIDKRAIGELIQKNSRGSGIFKVFNLAAFGREEEEPYFWTTLNNLLSQQDQEKKEVKIDTLYLAGFDKLGIHFQNSLVEFLNNRRHDPKFDKEIRIVVESARQREELKEFRNIALPSLRFRREDLPAIVISYIKEYADKLDRPLSAIGMDLIPFLSYYDFPGNFSELENLLKGAVLRCVKKEALSLPDLPVTVEMLAKAKKNEIIQKDDYNLESARKEFERTFLLFVMENTKGDSALAGRILDIPQPILEDRLRLLA